MKIIIDDKDLMKKLNELGPKISKGGRDVVNRTAEQVRVTAVMLAPHDTNFMRSQIVKIVTSPRTNSATAEVGFTKNPYPDKHFKAGGEFDLPTWMTYSRKAVDGFHPYGNTNKVTTFRSGNPRFLLLATEAARKVYNRDIGVMLRNNLPLKKV